MAKVVDRKNQVRNSNEVNLKKIIVAVDGSSNSIRAVEVAILMAKEYGSELVLLHVIQSPTYLIHAPRAFGAPPVNELLNFEEQSARGWAEPILDEARVKGVHARLEILRVKSSPVRAICQNAIGEKADLIVIGTRGRGGFSRLLLGSVSSGVVTHAKCAVLVVR